MIKTGKLEKTTKIEFSGNKSQQEGTTTEQSGNLRKLKKQKKQKNRIACFSLKTPQTEKTELCVLLFFPVAS